MKRTKIVCTIGPASEKRETLEKMMRAGMNVCRLNMSHGDYSWHARAIRSIRSVAKELNEPVAILLDLQGPKVRLGEIKNKKLKIKNNERIIFTSRAATGDKIPIAHKDFHKFVKKGSRLLIADGTIECVVERIVAQDIYARVILGGELKAHKGIAVQGVSFPLPSLTAKDKRDAAWARGQDIDFVALSFVKEARDVVALRKILGRPSLRTRTEARPPDIQIIVKIETREAVANFEEILKVADGVMIARGDLALATSAEEVPLIQKELIEKCRRAAKPVIVATEMLASMEKNPRPTRAEASDVANAVIDHTDAAMLSGESATGNFPVGAVSTMARIIESTEVSKFDDLSISMRTQHGTGEEETALLASVFARTSKASAIVAGSLSGHTGRLLSRYRTEVELILGSPSPRVVRQLNLSWGIRPVKLPKVKSMDRLLKLLLRHARNSGFKKGEKLVFLGSEKMTPHGQSFVGFRVL